ncbi:MAG TPA: ATP-binding protein [Myxococcota bacterium]|nr:ATP-binding protein [Myxococcota bacterium]
MPGALVGTSEGPFLAFAPTQGAVRPVRRDTILDEHLERAENEGPSYAEFLRDLLRAEYDCQQTRFLGHRIGRAKLPERWALESFPWDRQPGVQRAVIEQLARLDFMDRAGNLVLVGPTGVGKTGLSIGILLKALEAGHRGLFIKAQDLFDDMYASLADRSSRKLLNRLARIDLLVIDEMGYLEHPHQRHSGHRACPAEVGTHRRRGDTGPCAQVGARETTE